MNGDPTTRDLEAPAPQRDGVVRSLPALAALGFGTLFLVPLTWFWYEIGDPWGPAVITGLAIGLFGVHVLSARRRLDAADPVLWIPVLFLLFYFGMPIAIEFVGSSHVTNYDVWQVGIEPPKLRQAFMLALLTIVALLFGIHLAGFRDHSRGPAGSGKDWPDLLVPGTLLTLLGLTMMVLGVIVVGPGTYFAHYDVVMDARKFGGGDFRLVNVGSQFAPAGCYALLASHRPGRILPTLFALGVLGMDSLLQLGTGDRGSVLLMALSGAWVFSQRVRRLPFLLVLGGFLIGMMGGPIAGEYRKTKSLDLASQAGVGQLLSSTLVEMGSQLQVFCYTLEEIPKNKPYDWGLSVVDPIWELIPNPGLTAGRPRITRFEEHHPGAWVTATANPEKFRTNIGGYGYAIGAEWYFNFGVPGVAIGMTLLGLVFGRVRNRARDGPLWLVWSALFMGMLVLLVRNSLGAPLRTGVQPMVAIALITQGWYLFAGRAHVGARPLPAAAHLRPDSERG